MKQGIFMTLAAVLMLGLSGCLEWGSDTYTLGVTVQGLEGGIVLQNNGQETLTVTTNGTHTFIRRFAPGAPYHIILLSVSQTEQCTLTHAEGTFGNRAITDVTCTCTDTNTSNHAPNADAGADQNASVGERVTLDGSGSSDPDGDPLRYRWRLTPPDGSTTALSDTTAAAPTFVPDRAGTYHIGLTVSDGTLESAEATVQIVVTDPLLRLQTFQAADVVIGQPDLNTTAWMGTPPNARNYSGHMYSNPMMVGDRLYIGDEIDNRILGYNTVPQQHRAAADFVLGQTDFTTLISGQSSSEMKGAHMGASTQGTFFVDDYGNSRVLVYTTLPTTTGARADRVIGQAEFGDGAEGACTPNRLAFPEAIAAADGKLLIADSAHHRILIYTSIPTENNASADLVLGQSDLSSCEPNRGDDTPSADTLNNPSGIWSDGERVIVNDKNNNRVLIWNTFPAEIGQAADVVIGQSDFNMSAPNDDNQNGVSDTEPSARTFRGSNQDSMNGVAANARQLFIADIGNNRILVWNTFPTRNFQPADVVLGQSHFNLSAPDDVNQTGTWGTRPDARTLAKPNGLYVRGNRLFVQDEENGRILIFNGR